MKHAQTQNRVSALTVRGKLIRWFQGLSKAESQQPILLPDFGKHLAETGTPQKTMFIYVSWEMEALQIIGPGRYCSTRIQSVDGEPYCATFDFDDDILLEMMRSAPLETLDFLTDELERDEASTRSIPLPQPISVGVGAILGSLQQGLHDVFIPLTIVEVIASKTGQEAAL